MSIAEILMRRDGNTRQEAEERVQYCRQRLYEEAVDAGDYNAAEDIIAEELGLEPDYITELLF